MIKTPPLIDNHITDMTTYRKMAKRGHASGGQTPDEKRRKPMTPMQRYELKHSKTNRNPDKKDHTVFVYAEALCVLEDRDFERMKCGLTETIVSTTNNPVYHDVTEICLTIVNRI